MMNNSKSTASQNGVEGGKTSSSKGARVHRKINLRITQNVHLIWLDAKIDEENNNNYRHGLTEFQRIFNTINTFTDGTKCIEFIKSKNNAKACVIISTSLAEHILPHVHNMSQVDSIFIFNDNQEQHKQWNKNWPKLKGVFNQIELICEALKKAIKECEHNFMPMSFVPADRDTSNRNLDQLDKSFVHTRIIKDIMLNITFEQKDIQEFLEHCRKQYADNKSELLNIKLLERKYRQETPIWWYSYDCFLYPMLNRALRLMDMDIIIKMGFFIVDLHRNIEQLYLKQFGRQPSAPGLIVYRGQGVSRGDFEQMQRSMGGFMSFNNFLSTSKSLTVPMDLARRAATNPDMIGVLFVMAIDPSNSTTPFASIIDTGNFQGGDDILFSMHSVFRIQNIKPLDENHCLFQVSLILPRRNDEELHLLNDRIQKGNFQNSPESQRLTLLLRKMGHPYNVSQISQTSPEQSNDKQKKATFNQKLGEAKVRQGKYKEAMELFEKQLKDNQNSLPHNHPDIGSAYNNIAGVYNKLGDYSKTLSYYEKALAIWHQSLPSYHPYIAVTCNNIGSTYDNIGDYSKALSFHEKALGIKKRSLPPNHPDLGMAYNNIGTTYSYTGNYAKELSYYEKALGIWQQSLPPNHPHLGMVYNNIGTTYDNMGNYPDALSYYERGLAIWQQSLPANHIDFIMAYNNIGNVYGKMGHYLKALTYYEKGLAICKHSLPPNHPDFVMAYNSIGLVYSNIRDYPKALSYYGKALSISQQSVLPNHPNLGITYNNIGNVYIDMGDHSKALLFHEKALAIRQQTLPPNHPDFLMAYNSIGSVYSSMRDYTKALSYYEKALTVCQESLPPNHPDLGMTYNNIGTTFDNMRDYSNAISYYEKGLAICQQSLPPNHPNLQKWQKNLENIRKKL